MFPFMNPLAMRAKASTLPSVKVPKAKVLEMLVESGKSQKEAERTVMTMEIFNSQVMIGEQMVSISKE